VHNAASNFRILMLILLAWVSFPYCESPAVTPWSPDLIPYYKTLEGGLRVYRGAFSYSGKGSRRGRSRSPSGGSGEGEAVKESKEGQWGSKRDGAGTGGNGVITVS